MWDELELLDEGGEEEEDLRPGQLLPRAPPLAQAEQDAAVVPLENPAFVQEPLGLELFVLGKVPLIVVGGV